jgi:hypothetical protein
MKKLLILMTLTLIIFSCGKDDNLTADLIKDNGLNDAPFILAGEYIVATRFSANEMSAYQGRKLTGIEYYLKNKPTQCEVQVYSGSNGNEPGTLVYSKSVTVEMDADSWNLHAPSTDIDITGEDLWLAVRIVLNNEDATIGCDVGPAVTNGDWIMSSTDNVWQTYRDFTNPTVSINWNIRGHID